MCVPFFCEWVSKCINDDVVSNEARARKNNGDDYITNSWLVGWLALYHYIFSYVWISILLFVCWIFVQQRQQQQKWRANQVSMLVLAVVSAQWWQFCCFFFFPFFCYVTFCTSERVSLCVCVWECVCWNVWPLPLVAGKYLLLFSCLLLRSTVCSELDWHCIFFLFLARQLNWLKVFRARRTRTRK